MAGNIIELHTEVPAELEANVFGQFDEHLKLIERTLNVTVISRDGILKILGNEQNAASAYLQKEATRSRNRMSIMLFLWQWSRETKFSQK